MDDKSDTVLHPARITTLLRKVEASDFGEEVLKFVSQAGPIRNFGAYFWTSVRRRKAVLSISCGSIGDYWLHRDGADFVANTDVFNELQATVEAAGEAPSSQIIRFTPPATDPRYPRYQRAGMLERLSVATRRGDHAIQSFFLRSASDGRISDREMERFAVLLPIAHEAITLRHRIVGSEAFQFRPGMSVSSLKERGNPLFGGLSPREAATCDAILAGLSVAGTALQLKVSENTIRTLRRRAFRKLGVTSAQELMSLALFDTQAAAPAAGNTPSAPV
ncbi:helix-turn-helix transcriptional regulator [Roseibium sp.]|uniref:helix-turn-helix transcriptional regulator n=1 Tax=Roseibium sp. TaxID=1936156 RepID=UPI003D150AFA